jgi:MOSC domain-containing protein YiiM
MTEGGIEHIHIADAEGAPVRAVDTVQAIAGVGLEGDRYAKGKGFWPDDGESRDVTLIEAEAIEAAAGAGVSLAPGESRRNLTTRGIRLNDLVGKEFWIGTVLARGTDLCEPCTHLAALTGKPVIKPLVHRGGLRADLLTSGPIRVGDVVRVAEAAPTAPRE